MAGSVNITFPWKKLPLIYRKCDSTSVQMDEIHVKSEFSIKVEIIGSFFHRIITHYPDQILYISDGVLCNVEGRVFQEIANNGSTLER